MRSSGNVDGTIVSGFEQVGPVPFVQPGPPMLPFAFDQPPAYQAQSMCAALSRSPIVGAVCGTVSCAPKMPEGWNGGRIVFTA